MKQLGMFFAVDGDFGDRDGVGDVKLTGTKRAFLSVFTFDWIKENFIKPHCLPVPVCGALGAPYVLVWLPFGQCEVAVTDEIARARPSGATLVPCAEFFNRCAVERIP